MKIDKIEKVAIVGLGMMGASLAAALKNKFFKGSIIGYSRNENTCKDAIEKKIVDDASINLRAVVENADLIVTDVWASMGDEDKEEERKKIFKSLQVNSKVMSLAKKDVIFMHCLPAHRGEEVTEEVLNSSASVIWQEAENRLHAQKALLEYLLV